MHDEDNKHGIRVKNRKGDKWIAYGDGMLLNDESEINFEIAVTKPSSILTNQQVQVV